MHEPYQFPRLVPLTVWACWRVQLSVRLETTMYYSQHVRGAIKQDFRTKLGFWEIWMFRILGWKRGVGAQGPKNQINAKKHTLIMAQNFWDLQMVATYETLPYAVVILISSSRIALRILSNHGIYCTMIGHRFRSTPQLHSWEFALWHYWQKKH